MGYVFTTHTVSCVSVSSCLYIYTCTVSYIYIYMTQVVLIVSDSGLLETSWSLRGGEENMMSATLLSRYLKRAAEETITQPQCQGKRAGRRGPLAVLQSLMPSICLNGFLNPSPQFHSSPCQTVFRLLSPPVINPFISKRSDQCGLEWKLPCQGNGTGKTC